MDLAELKRKHQLIFCSEIAGLQIIWRPLTWKEHGIYTRVLEIGTSSLCSLQNKIFREIVLDPIIIDQMQLTPPGVVPSIVNTALFVSGNSLQTEDDMFRLNQDIEEMRGRVNTTYEQFILLICKAFPSYTPTDLENLEFQEVLRLLLFAEQMLELETPIVLEKEKKKRGLTDKLMEDRRMAEASDRPGNASGIASNVRDTLQEKNVDPSLQQARSIEQNRKLEMIKRIRERHGQ